MEDKKQPSGVGGWLLWLVLVCIVFSPLNGYIRLHKEESDLLAAYPALADTEQFKTYSWWAWLSLKVAAAVSISSGVALWRLRTRSTVPAVLWAWWASFSFTSAVSYFLVTSSDGAALGDLVGQVLGGAITLGVWTAYLLKSKRVKNTYTI